MRLLHNRKLGLEFGEFNGEDPPSYAILSHSWRFRTKIFGTEKARTGLGYEKIVKCKSGTSNYDYFWIDTCCVDKTSSAELSEAINSMYLWYEKAAVCYVYLSDVQFTDPIETFKQSRWFTRGWMLQELIAPATVVFFSKDWERISEKRECLNIINDITAVPGRLLSSQAEPFEFSVAERMSWASNRLTTRVEDEAYSLMGLFGVEPVIGNHQFTGLLAQRLKSFASSRNIHSMGIWGKGNVVGVTNRGIHLKLYLIPTEGDDPRDFVAHLGCWYDSQREYTVVIFLRRLGKNATGHGSAHVTQFSRRHVFDRLEAGARHQKIGGEYKEICVQDMTRTLERLNLDAYDYLGKYIHIRHPGRPFSVHQVDCWEPQSAIFTAPHGYSGTLGAVCVPIA
ncbi:MAG: hypothetical protein MMC33_001793 [Icmadophila ericetorum]|nr:hypothetical protein [Icmadophila ericetorum]